MNTSTAILHPPVDLRTKTATERLRADSLHGVETNLDKGMIPVLSGTEWDGWRFHHAIQDGAQFKTYEWFISGIFHLISI